METRFLSQIRSHGRKEIELKNHFPLSRKKREKSIIDIYFFFPSQFEINENRYGVKKFLSDLKTRFRYTTSSMSLNELVDEDNDLSPIHRIKNYLAVSLININHTKKICYEIKMLVNIYRRQVKEMDYSFGSEKGVSTDPPTEEELIDFLNSISIFLKQFRSLEKKILRHARQGIMIDSYQWANEIINISTERFAASIMKKDNRHHINKMMQEKLNAILNRNRGRLGSDRSKFRWDTSFSEAETTLYHESILKKWSQKVLYMETRESKLRDNIFQILTALAAAGAMAVAVVAAFFTDKMFNSYSIAWIVLIILIYVVKDRLKDIIKDVLFKLLPRMMSERIDNLIEPVDSKIVGKIKSVVRFLKSTNLDRDILKFRSRDINPLFPEEDVIHFRRIMELYPPKLIKNHTRLDSITEISRLKLKSVLEEMDSPAKKIYKWNGTKFNSDTAARVYGLNVVVKITRNSGKDVNYYRYRVIAKRSGIVRIDGEEPTFDYDEE